MSDTAYRCPYCRTESSGAGANCPGCGAPIDVQIRTTNSGWTELPPIADMAKIQLGRSSCQIAGRLVPTAEFRLAEGDNVYFPHPNYLWSDGAVNIDAMSMRRAWARLRAGLPLVMLQATGPGTIAFSHDTAGELLAVPLQPGAAVDVREHTLVVATGGIDYDWVDSGIWFTTSGGGGESQAAGVKLLKMGLEVAGMFDGEDSGGTETEWHYPLGRYLDRFTAGDRPGAVFIQAGGNAFIRDLAEGEQIMVKPPSLLFKDPSVGFQLHVEFPAAGVKFWRSWGNRYLWLRMWGPGRVALQSLYDRMEDPGTDFRDVSGYSQQRW